MNNEELQNKIIEKVQDKIAIFELKKEEHKMKQITKKLANIAATVVIVGLSIGTVYAGTVVYEKIWKDPIQKTREEVISEKTEVTEENKKEINISETEAEQIALLKLQQLGYSDIEFQTIELKKFIEDGGTVYYRAKTDDKEEKGIEIF